MSTDPKSVIPRSVLDVMQSLSTVQSQRRALGADVLEAARRPPAADPRDLIAASLAGGIIAASGRADWTAEEAVMVWREVRETLTMPTLRAGDVGGVEASASARTAVY